MKHFYAPDNVLRKSFSHWLSTHEYENANEYWKWLMNTYKIYYIGGDSYDYGGYKLAAEERDWTLFLMRWS